MVVAHRVNAEVRPLQQRNLGRSGLIVSAVGLGCNNFGARIDRAATRAVVHRALDLGIAFFDTSDTYGDAGASEEYLGAALAGRRDQIVLASKFARPMDRDGRLRGASRRYIVGAVEASLKRLNTDYLDLYQQHIADPLTPIEETLRALDDLVHHGKVRYIGCSTLAAWQVVEAQWTATHLGLERFVCCQERYNLLERELDGELMPVIQSYGLGLIPFSPLANGLLTGKYRRDAALPAGARLATTPRTAERYLTPANWAMVERLDAFCTARGHSLLQLAFGWLLQRPAVASVIAGATAPEQVAANVAAAEWVLSREDMDEIDRITAK
jgi:aryl-alcohol dehydrogenase-like predicted oxidoreductase